jgi:hypothetical protein
MLPLDETTIRASFANASRKEVTDISLPTGFAELDWNRLDYLGWRDPRQARRAYVVVPLADGPVGILLRQAEVAPRSRAQCSWCQDVHLPNDVLLYSASRVGAAGRNGNTVGILVCADFECSTNVRKTPPVAYVGFDVEAARSARIAVLRERASAFATGLLAGE